MENQEMNNIQENLNEDYGWEIPVDKAFDFLDKMEREIGCDNLLLEMAKALGSEKLADILAYIARNNDLDYLFDDVDVPVEDETVFDDEYGYR